MAVTEEKPVPATVDIDKPDQEWNVYQRLAWVAKRVAYIAKDREMQSDYMSYRYVSHDKVVAMLRKPILEAGLMLVTDVTDHKVKEVEGVRGRKAYWTEVTVQFTFVNVDDPSDFVIYRTVGQGMDMNDKGSGKAISYAVKYGFLKGFLLETGEDTDRESIDINAEPEAAREPEVKPEVKMGGILDDPIAYRKALVEVNEQIRELMSKYELSADAVAEMAGKPGDQMTVLERQRLVVKLEAKYSQTPPPSPRSVKELPMHQAYQLIQQYRQELGETDEADWLLLLQNEMGTRDLDSLSASQLHEFARRLEQRVLAKRAGVMKKGETKNGK